MQTSATIRNNITILDYTIIVSFSLSDDFCLHFELLSACPIGALIDSFAKLNRDDLMKKFALQYYHFTKKGKIYFCTYYNKSDYVMSQILNENSHTQYLINISNDFAKKSN